MPYTVPQLEKDDRFKGMPKHAIEIFVAAFNAAFAEYDGDEDRAFKTAWAAVSAKYKKQGDEWVEMSAESEPIEETAEPDIDTVLDAAIGEGRVVLMSDSATTESEAPIERDAKIFEAGRYDDKDIEVTEADLDGFIKNHQPAPIGYEHAGGKLRFGWLSKVWRSGKDLFGRLSFSPRAWETARECGLNRLSVTIPRDKSRIYGVDLVESPRVGDAAFEFAAVGFSIADSDSTKPKEVTEMAEEVTQTLETKVDPAELAKALETIKRFKAAAPTAQDAVFAQIGEMTEFAQSGQKEVIEMGRKADAYFTALQSQKAETDIANFKMNGKISKAAENYARAILAKRPLVAGYTDDAAMVVSFKVGDDEVTMHIAECFAQFLEAMPASIQLKELARMSDKQDGPTAEDRKYMALFGQTEEDWKKYNKAEVG